MIPIDSYIFETTMVSVIGNDKIIGNKLSFCMILEIFLKLIYKLTLINLILLLLH